MFIRDRVQELRRVRAGDLRPHPRNWRTHPDAQRDVLRGLLAEIGYADALLVREGDDGVLELIDGHLRAETTPDALVPVLVLDVTPAEADKLLLTLDPLAAMAGKNIELASELAAECETDNAAVATLLSNLVGSETGDLGPAQPRAEVLVPECYQVVVECQDEDHQQQVYERMRGEGFKCRLLTL